MQVHLFWVYTKKHRRMARMRERERPTDYGLLTASSREDCRQIISLSSANTLLTNCMERDDASASVPSA